MPEGDRGEKSSEKRNVNRLGVLVIAKIMSRGAGERGREKRSDKAIDERDGQESDERGRELDGKGGRAEECNAGHREVKVERFAPRVGWKENGELTLKQAEQVEGIECLVELKARRNRIKLEEAKERGESEDYDEGWDLDRSDSFHWDEMSQTTKGAKGAKFKFGIPGIFGRFGSLYCALSPRMISR